MAHDFRLAKPTLAFPGCPQRPPTLYLNALLLLTLLVLLTPGTSHAHQLLLNCFFYLQAYSKLLVQMMLHMFKLPP